MYGRVAGERQEKIERIKRIDHHKNRMGKMIACLVFCVIMTNTKALATEYHYDALGRLLSVQYENGDTVRYTYDANGNLQTYEYQADKREDGGDSGNEEDGKTDTGNAAGSDNSGKEVENNNREDSKEEQIDIGNKDDEDSGIQREDSQPGKPVVAQEPVREGDLFHTGTAVYQVTGIGKTKTVSLRRLTDKKAKSFKIPSTVKIKGKKYNVTKIASGAFQNRAKLTQVTVGVNVTGIGSKAFYGCKNLKKIIITSKKLKTTGVNAFRGISKKATIRVPRSRYKNYKKILNGKGQAKSVRIVQDK